MNFVHSTSTTELPNVARGPVPIMQWDMWVDSNDLVAMVADAPDEDVRFDSAARNTWLRGKAVEWFGCCVRITRAKVEWLDNGLVAVRGTLVSII